MIKNIIFSLILICLMVALSIKLIDSSITYVSLGSPFLAFLKNCNAELQDFKIQIPTIPKLIKFHTLEEETIEVNNAWDAFRLAISQFTILKNFFNAIIDFVNFITTIINVIISLFNVIISVIQFIIIVLKNLIIFRDNLIYQA